jgi:hypothetical protein
MRMWMVPPEMMCQQHLLGEHVELHMLAGWILHGRSLDGYAADGLVDTRRIYSRHTELAKEMAKRNMNHDSALCAFVDPKVGVVDVGHSFAVLTKRCPRCATLAADKGFTRDHFRGKKSS